MIARLSFVQRIRILVCGAVIGAASLLAPGVSSAATGEGWWHLEATAAPTHLPLRGPAQLLLTASNLGNADISGAADPIVLTNRLPAGVSAVKVVKSSLGNRAESESVLACSASGSVVECTFTGVLPPYEDLWALVEIEVDEPSAVEPDNVFTLEGGEGANTPEPLSEPLRIDGAATRFGVESYKLVPEEKGGGVDTTAGSHPYQLTSTLNLNDVLAIYPNPQSNQEEITRPSAPALPHNLRFKLPPGLIGDPSVVPECSDTDFTALAAHKTNLCPADTAIGAATVVFNEPTTEGFSDVAVPVFNLEPGAGEPARFGFAVYNVPVVLRTAVPAGGNYGVEVSVENASQAAQVVAAQLTLWGTPGDASHDASRGWECLAGGAWDTEFEPPKPCPTEGHTTPSTAFLTLPTSCEAKPEALVSTMTGESWPLGNGRPGQSASAEYTFPQFTGCDALEFNPALSLEPESHSAATPTGLDVGVQMPQPGLLAPEAKGRAEAALRATTVTLPPGLELNPAAANGLSDCSPGAFDFRDPLGALYEGPNEALQTSNETSPSGPQSCPDPAKVGTVQIETPLLRHELQGSVYLAREHTNPFQSPLVLYLVAEDRSEGIDVKLAGTVEVESNGQLRSTFENTPQVPFTSLHLHFFGGPRASLTTPASCGGYTTTSSFTPWSGRAPAAPSASFQIGSGADGRGCPGSSLPFSPSFAAGPTNPAAGAFATSTSPFVVNIGRPDGDQALTGITLHLPPGASAVLKNAKPCPEPPPGQEWSCGSESLLGHVTESAGLGSEPVTLTGELFLTTGYDGAPFGLLVRTHAAAGPFDLGYVNVRSRINVDPHTAAATITTDPGPRGEAIPTILKGVPVQLKALQVVVDRPNFEFNPTNCSPLAFTGALNGDQGAVAEVSAPFIAAGCANLPFHPTLEAFTRGQASKAAGAALTVRVTSSPGQANIAKTDLTLPKALPSRLTTIQKACLAATFEANPASCPEGSNIGTATAVTPQLNEPLSGPAYLVSHGNAAFPDVEFVLTNKEGIELILDGKTDIKNGITYSRFESVPDAPVTSFEAVLPEGPHSALATDLPVKDKYSFCGQNLTVPTVMTGQNGAVIDQTTKVQVQGCKAVKGSKTKKLTRKQKLAKALNACRKKFKHNKHKRAACEKKARKQYGPKKKDKKKPNKH